MINLGIVNFSRRPKEEQWNCQTNTRNVSGPSHCPGSKVVGLLAVKWQELKGKGTVRYAKGDLINQISERRFNLFLKEIWPASECLQDLEGDEGSNYFLTDASKWLSNPVLV